MDSEVLDFLIIGSGLSGIILSRKLSEIRPKPLFLMIEKSKGLGGRLATRRINDARFDHGAPFYEQNAMKELHALLLRAGVSHLAFASSLSPSESPSGSSHEAHLFRGTRGMTDLAKALIQMPDGEVPIQRESRAIHLKNEAPVWGVQLESGKTLRTRCILLTAPLPQALELLSASEIPAPASLASVRYHKAIALLFEGNAFPGHGPFTRFQNAPFLTLSNEQEKGISSTPAFTLTFSPSFSETHFEKTEPEILKEALTAIRNHLPDFIETPVELKKWRYSQVTNPHPGSFYQIENHPKLYLAGDGFAGAGNEKSTSGIALAVASALALARELTQPSQSESAD